tara:strand:- start:7665 stop:7961 length:297 start_codon:yes stop_codon:yes gene_type:complete
LIRTLVARQYLAGYKLTGTELEKTETAIDQVQRWFLACQSEMTHPKPEEATRLGLILVISTLQTAILFKSQFISLDDRTLSDELTRAFLSYVGGARIA